MAPATYFSMMVDSVDTLHAMEEEKEIWDDVEVVPRPTERAYIALDTHRGMGHFGV